MKPVKPDLFVLPRALAASLAARAALSSDLLLQRDALLAEIERLQSDLRKAVGVLRENAWRSRTIREALAELEELLRKNP